jgi:hypothetical protein
MQSWMIKNASPSQGSPHAAPGMDQMAIAPEADEQKLFKLAPLSAKKKQVSKFGSL